MDKNPYEEKFLIKPLKWKDHDPTGWKTADTSWVRYTIICRKTFNLYYSTGNGESLSHLGERPTLEEAQEFAEEVYLINMHNCLECP